MHFTNETLTVLWLGAGAVALWMLLPAVLNAVGLTQRRSVIEDNPSAVEPTSDDAEYGDLVGQLRSLGFEPVGPRTTTLWLFLHHWYRKFESRVFAAREGDCIALTYKLRTWDKWRLCFVTAFSDGAIVETANQMANFRIDEAEHRRWGLVTPDRGLLLERHRGVCREFATEGSRTIALLPAEQVNQCIQHQESRGHRGRHRWTGLNTMSISLCCLGIGLVLIRYLGGNAPYHRHSRRGRKPIEPASTAPRGWGSDLERIAADYRMDETRGRAYFSARYPTRRPFALLSDGGAGWMLLG